MLSFALLIFACFIFGGMPSGYWLAKALKGIDIREHGSGSTGATNVWRCVSKPAGVTVFLLDLLKGFFPVLLAIHLTEGRLSAEWQFLPDHAAPVAAALATLVGHSKSVFLGFRGGKSAATGLGTLFAMKWQVGSATFLSWLTLVLVTKIVSVASIAGSLLCGIYFFLFHAPFAYVVYGGLAFVYITIRHKANLKRLCKGEEPKYTDKPKAPAASGLAGEAPGQPAERSAASSPGEGRSTANG